MVSRPISEPIPASIPEFFAGRSVLITGATGFMGKVLVERLLWTCPDIQCLYLLLRTKKKDTPEKRLLQLKQSQVFDKIRERCPQQLEKIVEVPGDITLPRLGMDACQMHRLREVSVVFHSAATVKFDEPLKVAVAHNVLPVIALMDVCDELPSVQVFVYVSSAYSNAERSRVEERVYSTSDVHQVLALLDVVPPDLLEEITARLVSPKPNTYTLTKALAESAVSRRGAAASYSAAIFRPTIVVSALRDPFPGWIENLNGPSGVVIGIGAGVLHSFTTDVNVQADLIPVDIAIDTLIAIAWETGAADSDSVKVYNCSSYEKPITWRHFQCAVIRSARLHPYDNALWYPFLFAIRNRPAQAVCEALLQTAPLRAAHCVLSLCGVKMRPSLLTTSQRLHAMNETFVFFSTRQWQFDTGNVQALRERLSPQDRQTYNLDPKSIDWDEHMLDFVKGARKYLLRQKDENLGTAQRRMTRLLLLHKATLLSASLAALWMALRVAAAVSRARRGAHRRADVSRDRGHRHAPVAHVDRVFKDAS